MLGTLGAGLSNFPWLSASILFPIGSAFVKRISSSSEKDVVNNVGRFCNDMRLAADQKN